MRTQYEIPDYDAEVQILAEKLTPAELGNVLMEDPDGRKWIALGPAIQAVWGKGW